jgi:hypothetical protein
MTRLVWTRREILAEHRYAKPHVEAGYRLHGGFDESGRYISPRTLNRWPAIAAWRDALKAQGRDLVDPSQELMSRASFPSAAQQSFLLELGLGQTLWNSLSVTGAVEARGRALADAEAPDFQPIVEGDISGTATAHLNKGLLRAHGLDEGGDPQSGQGGHDLMWFAVRDMLFGKGAYPAPEIPQSLSRPETGRLMPQIPPEHERWILLLMNVLMIEVRAEAFFLFCTRVMRDPRNFRNRRNAAARAAELVDRIRQDEAPHVAYLTVAVSELRSFDYRATDGRRLKGAEFIDPVWRGMVHWHAVANLDHERAQTRAALERLLLERMDGEAQLRRFRSLEEKEAA